jgi:hypothetical protein
MTVLRSASPNLTVISIARDRTKALPTTEQRLQLEQTKDEEFLKAGSRCRLGALDSKHMPRQTRSYCTVIGVGKTKNQVQVKFDGSKTAQTLHRSYLGPVAPHGSKPKK